MTERRSTASAAGEGERRRLAPEKPLAEAAPSLIGALRRARMESAEQSGIIQDLRGAEAARLELLGEALAPVLAQIPDGIDLFDIGIGRGERPRLFIDMVAFIEMGADRRRYVFVQDTREGRIVLAESEQVEPLVAAVTDYVARRIVARERALAGLPPPRAEAVPDAGGQGRGRGMPAALVFLVGLVAGAALAIGLAWLLRAYPWPVPPLQ